MLLACAGIRSEEALKSISALLDAGAVPDTWAPNGSSVRHHLSNPTQWLQQRQPWMQVSLVESAASDTCHALANAVISFCLLFLQLFL